MGIPEIPVANLIPEADALTRADNRTQAEAVLIPTGSPIRMEGVLFPAANRTQTAGVLFPAVNRTQTAGVLTPANRIPAVGAPMVVNLTLAVEDRTMEDNPVTKAEAIVRVAVKDTLTVVAMVTRGPTMGSVPDTVTILIPTVPATTPK